MRTDTNTFCIAERRTIEDAARVMQGNGLRIVLVVDDERRLLGTVTDGDLRRAMLAHLDTAQPVAVLLGRKASSQFERPIAAPADADAGTYLRLLREHNLLHLPVLDEDSRVVGLVTLEEFVPRQILPLEAVVVAGGRGTRLHPLTERTPKSMLTVGGRPILEIIIERLRNAGIKRVNVTTHHQGDKIVEHFGDGRNFGVELHYVAEDRPLGTAGGLRLMEPPKETLLVMNGDILTDLDVQDMLEFHRGQGVDLTVAVRPYQVQVPFGVVECQGTTVWRLTEKPLLNFLVNAGIYLLEPVVYQHLPDGNPCDMTDLIQRLLDHGCRVAGFPVSEYWMDIGQPADYARAQARAEAPGGEA